ncbi:histone-like nucleoid-structuring protein Lsr2, partial [Amycolatopsis pretoriensis]
MAQRVHVEMVDDLDGSEASQTVPFSLDGVTYEIDLSEDNASALRDELARYVG